MNVILAHHNFLRILLSNLSEELVPVEFQGIEHISNDLGRNQTEFSHPCEEFLERGQVSYRAARKDATPGELLAAIATDWFYRIPAIRMAEAHAQQDAGATYIYEFAWQSPTFDGRIGACHAMELPFVFDNLDKALPLLLTQSELMQHSASPIPQ